MSKLSGQERILKVLRLEEPDVVPHFDGVNPLEEALDYLRKSAATCKWIRP